MIKYYNQEKIERYKIKKGENRQRRMRVGLIVQGYINILSEIENSLESLINEYLLNNISNNDLSSNAEIIKKNTSDYNNNVIKDYKKIYKDITSVIELNKFILDISTNLTEKHQEKQHTKIMNYISNFLTVDKSLDDLHNMYKFFSKNNSIKSNDIDNSKENYLGTNSNFYENQRSNQIQPRRRRN